MTSRADRVTSLGDSELRVGGGRWRECRLAKLGQFRLELFLKISLQVATATAA